MAAKKPAKQTTPPSPDMDARPLRYAPAAAAPKPKEKPKRAKEPSPPLVDVGARDSQVRDAPSDEVGAAPPPRKKSKTKKTAKRDRRSAPPPSQDDEAEAFGDPSLGNDKRGGNISPPQEKDEDAGAVEVSSEAGSPARDVSSPERKKPAVERSWSQEDELKILKALVEHAQSNNGVLPDSSLLVANLTFDKADANADKLKEKIRKLKTRYRKLCLQGRPNDNIGRQLYELSAILWGQRQGNDGVPVGASASTMEELLNQRSSSYPYLAEEIKVYAKTHAHGDLITAAFATIDDDQAHHLDAMCKKHRVDALNLEMSQASLTTAMLSAFTRHINN